MRKLKVRTTLDNMPDFIEVDISDLKKGQYYIVRDIKSPEMPYQIMTHEGTVLVEVK